MSTSVPSGLRATWRPCAAIGGRLQQLPGQRLHGGVVAVGLVGLEHRELGIVGCVSALVAEDPADLVDPLDAADDQPLQVQLQRDAQVQVQVEGIDMGGERPRVRAAVQRLQHRASRPPGSPVHEVPRVPTGLRRRASRPSAERPGWSASPGSAGAPGTRSSVRPLCLSGSGRSALAVIANESARIDSSPRRDEITSPVTPTWSPRSTSAFQSASACSPDPVERHHHLDLAGAVPHGSEAELAAVAGEHDPPGDADYLAGGRIGGQVAELARTSAIVCVRG